MAEKKKVLFIISSLLWVRNLDAANLGFPGGASGKEPTCQCRRHKRCRFDLWVRKIPWRRAWQSTSILAWEIPWTEEPGKLKSVRSQRVRHDRSELTHTTWGLCFKDLSKGCDQNVSQGQDYCGPSEKSVYHTNFAWISKAEKTWSSASNCLLELL